MITNLDVKKVKLSELKFDDRNARKHDKKNLKSIQNSLDKFGQVEPLVVQKSTMKVIGGNGRLAAMKELKWKDCDIALIDIDDDKAKALGLVLNRSAELAEWEDDNLKSILSELNDSGWDIEGLGWDSDDLKGILPDEKCEGLTDEDAVPDVEQNVFGVKLGDIWQLGNHRMMCGDSTDKATVEKLMNGEKADMVFTDPPYGMNLKTEFKGKQVPNTKGGFTATRKSHKPVEGDDKPFDPGFLLSFFEYCQEIFLFGADYYAERIPNRIEGGMFVWDKNVVEQMDKMHNSAFELCWSKHKHKRQILRIRNGIYGPKDDSKKTVHPTQKKVQVPQWFIDMYSKPNNLIVDLFLGSGSTLIACEKTGRKCYGMELDPHYCSVIIKRWQDFTGKKAVKL